MFSLGISPGVVYFNKDIRGSRIASYGQQLARVYAQVKLQYQHPARGGLIPLYDESSRFLRIDPRIPRSTYRGYAFIMSRSPCPPAVSVSVSSFSMELATDAVDRLIILIYTFTDIAEAHHFLYTLYNLCYSNF